jgi:hypothetical protein
MQIIYLVNQSRLQVLTLASITKCLRPGPDAVFLQYGWAENRCRDAGISLVCYVAIDNN